MLSERLLQISSVFGAASLLSFGGGTTVVPQLQLATVEQHHWLTSRQFSDSFAITQVTPGPSTLLVTLLGYRADGLAGALVATVAMTFPASMVMWAITRVWLRSNRARWHGVFEHGMAPLGVGLVCASGVIVARGVDHGAGAWAITTGAAFLLGAARFNPLVVIGSAGLVALVLGGV